MKHLLGLLALLATGCATDPAPTAQPGDLSAQPTALPTGGPVAAVDGERQRLSTAQLLAYMPEAAGRFRRYKMGNTVDSGIWDSEGVLTDMATEMSVSYDFDEWSYSFRFVVDAKDLIDAPNRLVTAQREFEEQSYPGKGFSVTVEDITVSGLPAQTIAGGTLGPRLRLLIADRFLLDMWQTAGGTDLISMEDLIAFVEQSTLPRLADAPAFADAGDPGIPEWAAAQVAENEASAARYERARLERRAAESATATASTALRPCDEILSAAEVSGVLGGARVSARPTPGVEVEGRNCNRLYKPAGINGGIILIVSHYTNTAQAEGALRVASDHDEKVGLQPLAGGLNGVRYTHDIPSGMHISHFALGTDFVELKATAAGESVPEITPEQLAEVTAIAARNLGE